MHKLLIIDDSECREALQKFLRNHGHNIILLMDEEEFNHRIEKIINDLKQLHKMQRKMIVKTPEGIQKISVADIMYVQNLRESGQSLFYRKNNKELLGDTDLLSLEGDLEGFNFIRVNEDYLLNADYMCQYMHDKEKHVLMEDGKKIFVAPDKEALLLDLLNNWK